MKRLLMLGGLTGALLIAAGCSKKEEPKMEAKMEAKTEPPKADPPKADPPKADPPKADPAAAPAADPAAAAKTAEPAPAAGGKKLFLDEHDLGKVSAKDVAEAHKKDLATEGKYGVEYLAYWVDEKAGKVWCLVDAPDKEAANQTHREAHGLVAHTLFEVKQGA